MREFKSAEKKNKRNPKQIDIDACNKGEAAKSARRELCIIIDGYFIDYRPLDARNNTKEASYLPCHLYRASSNCINDDDIERKEQSTRVAHKAKMNLSSFTLLYLNAGLLHHRVFWPSECAHLYVINNMSGTTQRNCNLCSYITLCGVKWWSGIRFRENSVKALKVLSLIVSSLRKKVWKFSSFERFDEI